jgi:hypothetical protein
VLLVLSRVRALQTARPNQSIWRWYALDLVALAFLQIAVICHKSRCCFHLLPVQTVMSVQACCLRLASWNIRALLTVLAEVKISSQNTDHGSQQRCDACRPCSRSIGNGTCRRVSLSIMFDHVVITWVSGVSVCRLLCKHIPSPLTNPHITSPSLCKMRKLECGNTATR